MYAEIEEVSSKICSAWEIDFLESIRVRVESWTLTENQQKVLKRIYEKACKSDY
jgi:hypothetical protein